MGDDCQIDFGEEWPKIVSATYLRRTTAPRALRPALLSSRLITVLNATLGVDPASCAILPRASPPRGPHPSLSNVTVVAPPRPRHTMKRGAVVSIVGVDRYGVGRDNGSRWLLAFSRRGVICEVRLGGA